VLDLRRWYFATLLVIRHHHGEPIPKREVIPCEVKAFAALIRPGRADAGPILLAILVFARVLAVIEDVRWCVRHRHVS
jgi:hypothetical protein